MSRSEKDQVALLQEKERGLATKIAKKEHPEKAAAFDALADAVNRYYRAKDEKDSQLGPDAAEKAARLKERIEKKKEQIEKAQEQLEKYEAKYAEVCPELREEALNRERREAEEEIATVFLEELIELDLSMDECKCLLPGQFLNAVFESEQGDE
jgi:uncharacterized protein (DUF342 family)